MNNNYQLYKDFINNTNFLSNYSIYKSNNEEKINNLINYFESLDINKKYYKMNISSKNSKFRNSLSNETIILKNIHNNLNKVTIQNLNDIKSNIKQEITKNSDILNLIINIIIDKCISDTKYIDLYIDILYDLSNIYKIKLDVIINKYMDKIYIEINNNKNDSNYINLCNMNKNIDNTIGLSILIIKLELKLLIDNYIDTIIDKMFKNIIIDNDDICYKYIINLYNIFQLLDKSYIIKYKDKFNNLLNKKINKRTKFIIMDILELI